MIWKRQQRSLQLPLGHDGCITEGWQVEGIPDETLECSDACPLLGVWCRVEPLLGGESALCALPALLLLAPTTGRKLASGVLLDAVDI